MSTSIVLTVVSDDHPGIVETLSQVVTDHGGNWAESSMMSLAGKFAGILLAEIPAEGVDAFLSSLDALEAKGLHIVAQSAQADSAAEAGREYSLELVGQDHAGIVRDITEVLSGLAINVQELETTVQSASMSGERLFMAHAKIQIPMEVSLDKLQDAMEQLANELMVDITLED